MVLVMVVGQSEGKEECTRTILMCGQEKEIGTARIQRKWFHLSQFSPSSIICVQSLANLCQSFDLLLF